MNISQKHSSVQALITFVVNCGYSVFIGPRTVRGLLLGHPTVDVDILTSAPEEFVLDLGACKNGAVNLGAGPIPTCSLGLEGKDGQRLRIIPGIEDVLSVLEGASFSCDAVAYCPVLNVFVDPFGGVQDIRDRRVAFSQSVHQAVKVDPICSIRAARLGAELEAERVTLTRAETQILSYHSCLQTSFKGSKKREIRDEILSAMRTPKPSIFWNWAYHLDSLGALIPEMTDCWGFPGGSRHDESVWDHLMMAGDAITPRYPLVRLAAFLHDVGKPPCHSDYPPIFASHHIVGGEVAKERLHELHFSWAECKKVARLIREHMFFYSPEPSSKAYTKLLNRLKEDGAFICELQRIAIADVRANLAIRSFGFSEIKELVSKVDRSLMEKPHPPKVRLAITGHDVMDFTGLSSGKKVGSVLKLISSFVQENPEKNNREDLLVYLAHL